MPKRRARSMRTYDIKAIARKAGVSVATISRATNPAWRHKVAPKTLAQVDAVIRRHHYTPNVAAKYLRQTSTNTIGVILPYYPGIFTNPYYTHILSGVSDVLLDSAYQFKLLLLRSERQRWDHYNFRAGERVDGLIITHWPQFFSHQRILERLSVPCVVINDLQKGIKVQFVCGDHVQGGWLAAAHLYAAGHRRIGALTGPSGSIDSQQRLRGFQQFLRQRGLTLNRDWILNGEFNEQVACTQAERLLRPRRRPTAVFCFSDNMAVGVLRTLRTLGLSCPKDVSLVGYDDDPRFAAVRPPLTSIQVPVYELGRQAAVRLLAHLKAPKRTKPLAGQTLFPVRLVERESVSPVRPR